MKVPILDDYFDTTRTLLCFRKLAEYEVEIWNDHVDDIGVLATRLYIFAATIQMQPNSQPSWPRSFSISKNLSVQRTRTKLMECRTEYQSVIHFSICLRLGSNVHISRALERPNAVASFALRPPYVFWDLGSRS
jgi:D-3-phosphoglycerate dehydrogenase